jgi:transcriptional/translational regulatory protein YebC/TACO1
MRKLIAEALAAQVPRSTVEQGIKNYSSDSDRIEALVEIRKAHRCFF